MKIASAFLLGTKIKEAEAPPEPQRVVIFDNGVFNNVISGFNFSNFVTAEWSDTSMHSVSSYFGTAMGLYRKQYNAANFVLSDNHLIKAQTSTGASNGAYYIPIDGIAGYDTLKIKARISSFRPTSQTAGINYNRIIAGACLKNGQVLTQNSTDIYEVVDSVTEFTEYSCDISDLSQVDYIYINGIEGTVEYSYIALEKSVPTEVDWEVSWSFGFQNATGLISINSDYAVEYKKDNTGIVSGGLVTSNMHTLGRSSFTALVALVARQGSSQSLAEFTPYAQNAVIQDYTSGYEQLVIAKKNANVVIPAEIGFFWRVSGSAQGCILKRDGTFIPWSSPNTYGEVLAFNYLFNVLIDRSFTGTLKYYTFGNVDGQGPRWVNVQTPVNSDLTLDTMIVFAIPNS